MLALDGIEAIFKFSFSQEEAGMQLSPCGILFWTTKKISQKSQTMLLSVTPGEEKKPEDKK